MRVSADISDAYTTLHHSDEPIVVPGSMTGESPGTTPAAARNIQNARINKSRTPPAPLPPIMAGELITGSQITFVEFLEDDACQNYCVSLFGESGTAGSTMLAEFRKATGFHYYGHRHSKPGRKKPDNPGKLSEDKAATKELVKEFAHRAYRGDPDRRGVVFWERTAWLLWNAYSSLMALRHRAEKIKQLEIKRIEGLSRKRAERAAYMRRRRAKQHAKGAKEAKYVKEDARQKWREQRSAH